MRRSLVLLFALALFVPLAACGGDDDDSGSSSDAGSGLPPGTQDEDDEASGDDSSDDSTDAEEAGDPDVPPSIDDSELEDLADECFDGSGSACDELFFAAESGSEAEDYGNTCGGRFDGSPGLCATAIGD
jgi:hypothetical protein